MSANLHLLETLKEKLVNSDNFSEVMHYFFDYFAENPAFLDLGRLQHSSLVETLAIEAASSALGTRAQIHNMRLIRLPKEKFYHGPCIINDRMATLFFFEEIRTGMLAISDTAHSGQILYARMTAVAIQPGKKGKWN